MTKPEYEYSVMKLGHKTGNLVGFRKRIAFSLSPLFFSNLKKLILLKTRREIPTGSSNGWFLKVHWESKHAQFSENLNFPRMYDYCVFPYGL